MSESKHNESTPDLELVESYKRTSDKELVGILFKRYTHLVYGVCMKYLKNDDDAKDLVMQIFEKLLKDLHKYEIDNFKGWLYMVAKNQCFMFFRKKKASVELPHDLSSAIEGGSPDTLEGENEQLGETGNMEFLSSDHLNGEDKEKTLTLMEDSIQKLKPQQKQCIELFYLSQKSYEQVAGMTGFTLNEVKSHIQNGKRNLKLIMTNKK